LPEQREIGLIARDKIRRDEIVLALEMRLVTPAFAATASTLTRLIPSL